MNVLVKVLSDIRVQINKDVLQLAYGRYIGPGIGVNVDDIIKTDIIQGRVLQDTNILHGIKINIPLSSCIVNQVNNVDHI
jgi:hypothetical protein